MLRDLMERREPGSAGKLTDRREERCQEKSIDRGNLKGKKGKDQYLFPSKKQVGNREQPKREQHQWYQKKYENPDRNGQKGPFPVIFTDGKPIFHPNRQGAGGHGRNALWV
jgi:hypothetical protein